MPTSFPDPRVFSGLRRGACAAALAALVLGCSREDPGSTAPAEPAPQPPAVQAAARPATVVIPASTQATYGDLRIGAGNVRRDEYVLETGERRQGRVADLWLYYRDDASKNIKLTVYIGQRVRIGKYAFEVEDILGGKGSVHLRFETGL